METHRTYRNIKYLLTLCLSISLILSLTSGVHMHVQYSDHAPMLSEHILDIHSASGHHDLKHDSSHIHSSDKAHHSAVIDINSDSLIKKPGSLNPFILFVFFSWLLLLPLRQLFNHWVSFQQQLSSFARQLLPPLRAPPSFK